MIYRTNAPPPPPPRDRLEHYIGSFVMRQRLRRRALRIRWLRRRSDVFFYSSIVLMLSAFVAVCILASWLDSRHGQCCRDHVEHHVQVSSMKSCRSYTVKNAPESCINRWDVTVCDERCHAGPGATIQKEHQCRPR